MKYLFLSGFFLTRKVSFMGTTNEAEAETTEIGIATLAQTAAQSSVESHQSISPEKISKTNKTDLQ